MPQRHMPAIALLTFHIFCTRVDLADRVVVPAREGTGAKQQGKDAPATRGICPSTYCRRRSRRIAPKKGVLGKKEADLLW